MVHVCVVPGGTSIGPTRRLPPLTIKEQADTKAVDWQKPACKLMGTQEYACRSLREGSCAR
jgi:hypothetical protein